MSNRQLHVGVNLLYLRPGRVGGSEVYARNVIEQLANHPRARLTLFCSRESASSFHHPSLTVVNAARGAYQHVGRLRDENFGMVRLLAKHPVDVLWSPANFCAPLLLHRVPQVVTVHDLQHHWLPEHFPWAARQQRTGLFAASFLRARRIIAISEFTRRDVIDRYRLAPHRVVTILEGVRSSVPGDDASAKETVQRLGISTPFFFYPASDHAHKNHARLLDSFLRLRRQIGHDVHLVLCGARGSVYERAERQIRATDGATHIHHLGFLDRRDDVFNLLRASAGLVFPSEFEGFGLPPIEAQKVGTPVIASDRASIPEVVGAGGLLLDPMDVQSWADAMGRVLTDPTLRDDLVAKGYRNVQRFSWETCASETLSVLEAASRPT